MITISARSLPHYIFEQLEQVGPENLPALAFTNKWRNLQHRMRLLKTEVFQNRTKIGSPKEPFGPEVFQCGLKVPPPRTMRIAKRRLRQRVEPAGLEMYVRK